MINYLRVATAKNLQNKNIIKKEKRSDDAGYAAVFSTSIKPPQVLCFVVDNFSNYFKDFIKSQMKSKIKVFNYNFVTLWLP